MQMITWKRKIEQFTDGEDGYLGKIKVFSAYHDGGCPPPGRPYCLICLLPGVGKKWDEHFSSLEGSNGSREAAEKLLAAWLKDIGLQPAEL